MGDNAGKGKRNTDQLRVFQPTRVKSLTSTSRRHLVADNHLLLLLKHNLPSVTGGHSPAHISSTARHLITLTTRRPSTHRLQPRLLYVTRLPPTSRSPDMPSTTGPVNEDTLITIKISFDDSIKRLKLPLKDLGANTLPIKVPSAYRHMKACILADSLTAPQPSLHRP